MTKVVITAAVTGKASVTLSSSQPGLDRHDTFQVTDGDTLEWRFQDAQDPSKTGLGVAKAQVKFVGFPRKEERPLLVGGNTLEADARGVIRGGEVDAHAFNGSYRYLVRLVSSEGATDLECSWAPTVGAPAFVTGMGGGKRGGGPGGP